MKTVTFILSNFPIIDFSPLITYLSIQFNHVSRASIYFSIIMDKFFFYILFIVLHPVWISLQKYNWNYSGDIHFNHLSYHIINCSLAKETFTEWEHFYAISVEGWVFSPNDKITDNEWQNFSLWKGKGKKE